MVFMCVDTVPSCLLYFISTDHTLTAPSSSHAQQPHIIASELLEKPIKTGVSLFLFPFQRHVEDPGILNGGCAGAGHKCEYNCVCL